MKKLIVLVLVTITMFSFVGCNKNQFKDEPKDIEYVTIDIEEVNDEVENNRARAEEEYIGKYVSFECVVTSIESKKLFKVSDQGAIFGIVLNSVECAVKDKDLQNAVLTLNKGDKIKVKGKITKLGYFGSFSMQVYEIE